MSAFVDVLGDKSTESDWQQAAKRWNTRAHYDGIVIPRELYDFLMGAGEIDGTTFGDMHEGLPGAFWWRALLQTAALRTPPVSHGWQPIESAPKDRWVYTWGPEEGHGIARFDMSGAGWERSTHYRSLPPPPVSEGVGL